MNQANLPSQKNNWTVIDSSNLYGLNRWGDKYFSINSRGNINVSPKGEKGSNLDLMELVKELEDRKEEGYTFIPYSIDGVVLSKHYNITDNDESLV